MPNNHNNQLSTVLDVLRFPMIVLVLFMHVVPISANAIPHEFSWESLYLFTTEFVAHNFGRIAVPIFFLISGYLFFLKAPYFLWSTQRTSMVLARPHLYGYHIAIILSTSQIRQALGYAFTHCLVSFRL